MQKWVTLSGLIGAAAGIGAAALMAFLIHFAWIAALFIFFGMIVLVCVFAGVAPNANLALQMLDLLLSIFYIALGVCGTVFFFGMFWGTVFSAWKDIREWGKQRPDLA